MIMSSILYVAAPIAYWNLGMWLWRREYKNRKLPGHIAAINGLYTIIGVVAATVATWILMWIIL